MIYCTINSDKHFFLFPVILVTSSWANKCLHIPEKWLFAFRFCSFLHMYSPLAGVEFNRLVSSDLQILDSQGWLFPPEKESFLPGFLQTKLSVPVLSLACNPVSASFGPTDRKTKGNLFFSPAPQLQCAAVMKYSCYWFVFCLCGLFSEHVGFKQHIF